jgi:hypothetical protein
MLNFKFLIETECGRQLVKSLQDLSADNSNAEYRKEKEDGKMMTRNPSTLRPCGLARILIVFVFALALSFGGCKKQSESQKEPPKKEAVSPAVKFPEIEGWKLGEVKTYKGEELYTPIDGEADRYFPFGFEQAYFASYEKGDGKGIVDVQIYQMDSPDNAFGIYSMYDFPYREPKEFLPTPSFTFLTDSTNDFIKGNYFVRISLHEMDPNKTLLSLFGESIAQILNGEPHIPEIINLLPDTMLVLNIKYLRKWESFRELNYVITENIFGLSNKTEVIFVTYSPSIASSYNQTFTLIKNADKTTAFKAFENIKEYYSKDEFFASQNDSFLTIQKGGKVYASAFLKNSYYGLFSGSPDPLFVGAIMKKIEKQGTK